jgi:predicted PurR-regulated permease PerM
MKGISDFVAFLIILVIIVGIILPLGLFLLNPYYQSQQSESQNPQIINNGLITITYVSNNKGGIVNITYSTVEPEVIEIYNYSNGIWVKANYSFLSSCKNSLIYKVCGYAPEIDVELNIAGRIYYATVSYGSTAKVT